MSYLASSKVYVYPCANRSNTYATSKFINEENIILNVGKRPNVDGFVISYNNNVIEFNLGGYYFNCTLDALTDDKIYAHIKLSDNTINADSSATTNTTKHLVSLDESKNLDDNDTFYGLSIDNSDDNTNYTFTLHILTKVGSTYSVPNESYGSIKSYEILIDNTNDGPTTTLNDILVNKSSTDNVIIEFKPYLVGKIANASLTTAIDFDSNTIATEEVITNKLSSEETSSTNIIVEDIKCSSQAHNDDSSTLIDFNANTFTTNNINAVKQLHTSQIDLSTSSHKGATIQTNDYTILETGTDGAILSHLKTLSGIDATFNTLTVSTIKSSTPISINANVGMANGTTFRAYRLNSQYISNTNSITTSSLTSTQITSTGTSTLNETNITTLKVSGTSTLNETNVGTGYYLRVGGTEISEGTSGDDIFSIDATTRMTLYAENIDINAENDIQFKTQYKGQSSITSVNTILDRLDNLGFKEGAATIIGNSIPSGVAPPTITLIKQGKTIILDASGIYFNVNGGNTGQLYITIPSGFGPLPTREFSFTYYQNIAGTRYLQGKRGNTQDYRVELIPNQTFTNTTTYVDISFQLAWRLN